MKHIAIALLAATLSCAASAEGYVGVGFGTAYGKSQDFGTGGIAGLNVTKSQSGNASKLFGGYRFNKFIGAELAYTDLGSFHYKYTSSSGSYSGTSVDTKYHVSALSVAAVGTLPLGDFALFGKLGLTGNKAENSTSGIVRVGGVSTGLTGSDDKNKVSYLAGLGASYALNKNVSVRAEYELFGKAGDQAHTGRMKDLQVASLGLAYSF